MEVASQDIQKENNDVPLDSSTSEPSPQPTQEPQKKSKKDDRIKTYEQFMRYLNSLPTMEEKFSSLCKRYSQAHEENKKLQFYIKQSDKRNTILLKEKEHLQLEYNKAVLVKSKLENLCRELQKQNKAIKEESLQKIREEELRRKDTQAKFQSSLSEITTLLDQNNEKTAKLRDDNNSMTEKFKSVVSEIQIREQQIDKMARQMALENQLSEAKLHKASLEHQAEKERLMSELDQLKLTVAKYHIRIVDLQETEAALKGQLDVYTNKYNEFETAIVKSNKVFGSFKEQMETMSKKIRDLEKDCLTWKKRWEASQKALLDMCEERQTGEEKAASTQRLLQQMQSLCRTLQAERTLLLNTLKEHNIERPPLPTPASVSPVPQPPTSASTPTDNLRMDAIANCSQLRQSLAQLQSQLTVLTTNKNGTKEESPKPESKKKSKPKKSKAEKQAQKADLQTSVKDPETDESEAKEIKKEGAISGTEPAGGDPPMCENQSESNVGKEEKIHDETVVSLDQAVSNADVNSCHNEEVSGKCSVEQPASSNDTHNGVSNNVDEAVSNNAQDIVINNSATIESVSDDSNKTEILPVKTESNLNEEISQIPEVNTVSNDAPAP